MRFRRYGRRRSRATWAYADAEELVVSSTGATSYCWLIPPARVNYLCDTDRVDHVTFQGAHLWLDWWWQNAGAAAHALFDMTFYAIVSQLNIVGLTPVEDTLSPFQQPSVPSTITSWSEYDTDGTDSFMWVHHMKGQTPPNALIRPDSSGYSATDMAVTNQSTVMSAGSSDAPHMVCRTFKVAAEWQPDVIIKTRRRLRKDEGVALVMTAGTTPASGAEGHLVCRSRTLVRRGR